MITTGVLLVSILGSSISQLTNFDRCASCVASCKKVYYALPFVKRGNQVAITANNLGVSAEDIATEVAAEVATQADAALDEEAAAAPPPGEADAPAAGAPAAGAPAAADAPEADAPEADEPEADEPGELAINFVANLINDILLGI